MSKVQKYSTRGVKSGSGWGSGSDGCESSPYATVSFGYNVISLYHMSKVAGIFWCVTHALEMVSSVRLAIVRAGRVFFFYLLIKYRSAYALYFNHRPCSEVKFDHLRFLLSAQPCRPRKWQNYITRNKITDVYRICNCVQWCMLVSTLIHWQNYARE